MNESEFKLPPEVKQQAVKELRSLIVQIENDEMLSFAWCGYMRGNRFSTGAMNSCSPWMLGAAHMLASGIEHALAMAMTTPQENPAAHLRVVPGTNAEVTPIRPANTTAPRAKRGGRAQRKKPTLTKKTPRKK